MRTHHGMVLVVDDDASVRKALRRLFHATGRDVETFASAAEFTGHGDDEVRRRALDGGAIAVLDKPFDDQSLLDAVEWALAS